MEHPAGQGTCSESGSSVTVTGTAGGKCHPIKTVGLPLEGPFSVSISEETQRFYQGLSSGFVFSGGTPGFCTTLAELSSFIPINLPCSCLASPPNSEELSNRNKSHCWIPKDLKVFPKIISVMFSAEGPPWTKRSDLSHLGLPLLHIPTLPEAGKEIKHSPGPNQSG